jgi:hypothetical protein
MEPCCAVCFLGRTPKCKTPSVDVQSVPRFTLLEHYGSQVYQKRKPSALAFMGSLCNATTPPTKKIASHFIGKKLIY